MPRRSLSVALQSLLRFESRPPQREPGQSQKALGTSEVKESAAQLFRRPASPQGGIRVAYTPFEGAGESDNEFRSQCFPCSMPPELFRDFLLGRRIGDRRPSTRMVRAVLQRLSPTPQTVRCICAHVRVCSGSSLKDASA